MWFPIERIVSTTKPNKIWSNFGVFSAKSGSVARGAGRLSEVESLRTSLASRTHFEVLGLEVSSVQKLPCPRLEDSSIFEPLKFLWKTPETLRKICKDLFLVSSSRDRLKKIIEDLFRLKKIFEDLFLRSPEKKI